MRVPIHPLAAFARLATFAPLAAFAPVTALLVLAPLARAAQLEKVTEERVRAAYAEARAVLESDFDARFHGELTIRLVTSVELGRRIAEENLPIVRLRQPDEEKATAEAKALGDAAGPIMFAKYAWSTREFLVVPKTWELSAKLLERPELTSDETLRAVMVHELVHAWDDALHDLSAFIANADSVDAANAVNAIIEGHAQYTTRRVCAAHGWSKGFDTFTSGIGVIPESSKASGEGMMTLLRAQSANTTFAYHDGESFVTAIGNVGGPEALARAFRDPPRDGETILHPEWFLDPRTRPVMLYDPEPALDLFVARFPADVWTSQRLTVQSNQLEAALVLLPKVDAAAIVASVRNARLVALYPAANPAEKMVVMTILEFGTEAEARAYVAMSDRLSKLKDEQMKSGVVRITGSTTSTLDGVDTFGFLQHKQMKNGVLAFDVLSLDLGRGKLVVETLLSGEPLDIEPHVKLGIALLEAVKKREAK
ncbi:MAG: hypothetical protein HZA52_00165 [Planctomycetes bacterium]|nr:hypothetical protein [Planctomycetota bacterium]